MRRGRCVWILVAAALVGGIAAAPAQAITGVYSVQSSVASGVGTLVQYTVGPGGALSPSTPDTTLPAAPQDVTVTPDGRFAYVMTSLTATSTIVRLARVAANGRLEPATPSSTTNSGAGRAIIVNPQGTRVLYAQPGNAIFWRAIAADGTLGAPNPIAIPTTAPPADVRFLAMTADGRNLYAADLPSTGSVRIWQFTVDPATGAATPKSPAVVGWPTAGGPTIGAGRMAIAPSGSQLYLATDTAGAGIGRWTIDPGTGALTGGAVDAPAADGYAEAAVALSTSGNALWAPSGGSAAAPERVRQLAVGGGGVLTPLAPPAVNYVVAGPARDLVASPDGQSLYLGQHGTAGEWSVAPDGTLTYRANSPAGPVGGVANVAIALQPAQAPVAAFVSTPSFPGSATAFDASASSDPDGTVARYDWDFGDGTSAANGGPTPSHVYATAGARIVTLTVTDADGTSTARLWTGTRTLRNGGPSAQATRAVDVPSTGIAPPPPGVQPRPHKGRSVTVAAERGTILVRVPGSRRYVPIASLTEIPLGSIIDARKGRARITVEVDARTHKTQSSLFYDWFFRILQTKGSKPITEARLVKGSFAGCTPKRTRAASASLSSGLRAQSAATKKRSKRKIRQLWGHGNGSFRTGGKRSAATVRGTWWLVTDRCDATLTRVKVGRVDVRDFRLKKTVRLRAGKRSVYLAKAP
jgi:hypothetical protein